MKSLKYKLPTLLKVWGEPAPDILVIHCGANDVGLVPVLAILKIIDEIFEFLHSHLPHTVITWSQLLPCVNWRYCTSTSNEAMERARKRINRYGAMAALKSGGHYVLHRELTTNPVDMALYDKDGVHLSSLGNDMFLNNPRAGVEQYVKS